MNMSAYLQGYMYIHIYMHIYISWSVTLISWSAKLYTIYFQHIFFFLLVDFQKIIFENDYPEDFNIFIHTIYCSQNKSYQLMILFAYKRKWAGIHKLIYSLTDRWQRRGFTVSLFQVNQKLDSIRKISQRLPNIAS